MKVRSARVEDAVALAALHVRTWQSAYAGLIPQHVLDGLDIRQRRRAWRERIRASAMEGSAAGTLVAVTSTALVGFVHFGPTRDDGADPTIVGEIASLYVAPEQWGAGSGRRLLMTAVAALREVGFREATCWVLESNDRARRFYETNSWQLDGTAKDDESHGVTLREVRYWLPLT